MKLLRLPRLRSVFREEKKEKIELDLPPVKPNKVFCGIEDVLKDDLVKMVTPLIPYLEGKELVFTKESDPQACESMTMLLDTKQRSKLLKDNLLHIYASYGTDLENLYYTVCRDETMTKGWRKIIDMAVVDAPALAGIFGRRVVTSPATGLNEPGLAECLFNPLKVMDRRVWGGDSDKGGNAMRHFSIYPATRRRLAQLFIKPEAVEPSVMSVLPAGINLAVENFEGNIPGDLAYLSALDMTGRSVVQPTVSQTAVRIKSIRKGFDTPGFLPTAIEYPVDRVEMLSMAYSMISKKDGALIKVADFAMTAMERIPRMISGAAFNMFLPAFKGFTKTWAVNDNVPDILKMLTTLLMPATKGWMSLHNLKLRYLCYETPGCDKSFYFPLFNTGTLYGHTLKRKSEASKYYSRSPGIDWFGEVTFPFIVHWIRFLCALGMVEIAVDRSQLDNADDPLEAMRYVKYTALGKYALGLEKRYVSPVMDLERMMDIDDRSGIITVMSANCPYLMFLRQISEPIGGNRLRITPRTLLMNSSGEKAARQKIANLGNIINLSRLPNIRASVDEALIRCSSTEPVAEKYSILKIKSGIPGLVSFIAGNPQIRSNCILCERGMILVPKAFTDTFTEICRNNGYLLAEE